MASRRTSAVLFLVTAMLAAVNGCNRSAPRPSETPEAPPVADVRARFEEVAEAAGLRFRHQLADGKLSNIMESDGAGGCVLDFDGDGFADVYLVNSGPAPRLSEAAPETIREPNRLFRNRRDGTFEDVTARAGVAGRGFGTTAAAADYDNDGDTDLLAVNFDGAILFENRGDGTFREVTMAAGLGPTNASISATFFDADRDGFLDLFIANYLVFDPAVKPPSGSLAPYPGPLAYAPEFNRLYRNRGDGTFEDVSAQSGIRIGGHRAMSVAPVDYDLDGDTDLYVANDGTANLLLANDGNGHFTDVALRAGVAVNQFGEAAGSMAAAVGDVDGDGLPDLFVTRFGLTSLYINSPGGLFEDRVGPAGILNVTREFTGWGGNLLDFDNDGDLDLFVANGDAHFLRGMPGVLLENDGRGTFRNIGGAAGPFFRQEINGRGSGVLDFDHDGRCDLVVTTLGGAAHLLQNRTSPAGHWITLQFEGTRSNRDGFGALVKVSIEGTIRAAEVRCPTTYVFQSEKGLHFGLGDATRVGRIEVRWPSGVMQTLLDIAGDQILKIREPGESRWR